MSEPPGRPLPVKAIALGGVVVILAIPVYTAGLKPNREHDELQECVEQVSRDAIDAQRMTVAEVRERLWECARETGLETFLGENAVRVDRDKVGDGWTYKISVHYERPVSVLGVPMTRSFRADNYMNF